MRVKDNDIVAPYRKQIKFSISTIFENVRLVGFLANDDPNARIYARVTGSKATHMHTAHTPPPHPPPLPPPLLLRIFSPIQICFCGRKEQNSCFLKKL